MSRDEGTRLWRPLDGGGMSVVQLSCAPAESDDVTGDAKMSYCIIGCKENDVSLDILTVCGPVCQRTAATSLLVSCM